MTLIVSFLLSPFKLFAKQKASNKKLSLVTYNLQLGRKPWEFVEKILQEPCDIFCFQRFPEKWIKNIKSPHTYQPSYPGSKNGCVSIFKEGTPKEKGYSFEQSFENLSQGVSYISTQIGDLIVVNTLPPFPEAEVTEQHFIRHLNFILKGKTKRIIVGDFHFPDHDFPKTDMNGFKNYSVSKNFFDEQGKGLNLSKFFANFPLKASERLLHTDPSPQTHNPIKFEVEL